MSKRPYTTPTLVHYGSVGGLTQGTGGHNPDLGTLVNNTCPATGSGGFCLNK